VVFSKQRRARVIERYEKAIEDYGGSN